MKSTAILVVINWFNIVINDLIKIIKIKQNMSYGQKMIFQNKIEIEQNLIVIDVFKDLLVI